MKTLYLPDAPINNAADDRLDLATFVTVVRTAVLNASTPYVFGIFGDWGVGKTSTMKLMSMLLEEDIKRGFAFNIPIWINAWKFENELSMVYPILYALKQDYEERLGDLAKAAELKKDLIRIVGGSILALTDLGIRAISKAVTGESIQLKDIEDRVEEIANGASDPLEKALDTWATQVSELPELYENFVEKYAATLAQKLDVEASRIRFVFLIDDLDRCLPDTTISVLERIKNFLSVSRCLYVLGINPQIVQQGIRAKFAAIDIDGREYLEKIVNHAFYVPEASAKAVGSFAATKLEELLPEDADKKRFASALNEFGDALGSCEFRNPRKVLRVLNRYLAFLERQDATAMARQTGNIVRFLILAEYFPVVFQVLSSDPAKVASEVRKVADGTTGFAKFEADYGTLGLSRERIAAVRGLFDLQAPFQAGDPTLKEQFAAVAQFTRVH